MAESSPPPELAPNTDNDWPRAQPRAWFGIVGAPTAWAFQGLLGWLITGNSCLERTKAWGPFPPGFSWALEWFVCLVCLAVGVLALWFAIEDFRRLARHRFSELHEDERPPYLAAYGIVVSAIFVLAMSYALVGLIFLSMCERTR